MRMRSILSCMLGKASTEPFGLRHSCAALSSPPRNSRRHVRYWQRRSNDRSSDIFALVTKKTHLELTEPVSDEGCTVERAAGTRGSTPSKGQTALNLRGHQIQSDNRRYCWLLLSPWLLSPWLLLLCLDGPEPARAKDATAGNVKMIGATKVPFFKTSLLVVRSESDICHLLHCQLKAFQGRLA